MDLINTFFGIEALSTVNHIMDQSFLQGVNNIINVLGSTEEAQLKNRFERWGESTMKVICSIAMPNTLSAINRTRAFDGLEFLPDVRILEEMSTSERLAKRFNYIVRDRTFRLDDAVPVRVNWKGQPIRQTPAGANRFAYQLLMLQSQEEMKPTQYQMKSTVYTKGQASYLMWYLLLTLQELVQSAYQT